MSGDTPDGAALRAGTRLEEYEIRRVLGGGGFGITYLAHDAHLDLPVALKEYFPAELLTRAPDGRVQPRTGDAEALQRFELGLQRFVDEARTLANFRHPHIVRVLRYFKARGTAYIVMEYERGQSLRRWVPQHTPLTQAMLLTIILPLLDGLEAVHTAGFLHRDIKPDNIYVREDGSPVLLDFGAARRVQPHGEMTNIVSPGFAPFEQYHAQGDQGPWTDIYSLGAVMYWMVCGIKPLEAASRIQCDTLRPASELADPSVFSASLAKAIDWALQTQERRRPPCVADLRAAIRGGAEAALAPTSLPVRPQDARLGLLPRRNLLSTVLFLDLVGYSSRSVDDQVAIKRMLSEALAQALREVPEDTRVTIDTGDGAALCFLGDPEEALQACLRLRELLSRRGGRQISVRMGLNLGPVRIVSDINDRINVIGDGINVAQRIMDFARPDQLLVSRACHDVITRISDGMAGMFRYLGPHQDKHGRIHEVHAVVGPPGGAHIADDGPAFARTVPLADAALLDEAVVQEIEADLARRIGPMARVLVAKARWRTPTGPALRAALAALVPDLPGREAFLHGPDEPGASRSTGTSGSPSAAGSGPAAAGPSVLPALLATPGTQGLSGPPAQPLAASASSRPPSGWSPPAPQALAVLEQALSRHIGPMARVLLRRQLEVNQPPTSLVEALCAHIGQPGQREAFRALAQRLLRQP